MSRLHLLPRPECELALKFRLDNIRGPAHALRGACSCPSKSSLSRSLRVDQEQDPRSGNDGGMHHERDEMRAPCPSRPRQRGQATTEFAVLALALVPIFIAIPLIGKYIDVNQAAEQASRYVAFEAAARNTSSSWKTDAEIAVELRRRFFRHSDARVTTNDVAGDFAAHRNPVWTD